jgi:hypothetical protein
MPYASSASRLLVVFVLVMARCGVGCRSSSKQLRNCRPRVAEFLPHLGVDLTAVDDVPVVIVHRGTSVQAVRFFTAVHFPTKNTRTNLNKL